MGGKRKRCEQPRPLPSSTEASLGGSWGPGSPKGALRGGLLAPLSSGWPLTPPSQRSIADTRRQIQGSRRKTGDAGERRRIRRCQVEQGWEIAERLPVQRSPETWGELPGPQIT